MLNSKQFTAFGKSYTLVLFNGGGGKYLTWTDPKGKARRSDQYPPEPGPIPPGK